jgi:imidazolonepropionase-like amidohydrolase
MQQRLAISNGTIVDIGTGLDGDVQIDATGLTVLPGLIDCHVHAVFSGMDSVKLASEPFSYQFYAAQRNLMKTLDAGVTTVRDAGGADLGVKKAVADGLMDGPDMVIAVTVLSQTGGHADGWNVHGDLHRLLVPHPGRPDTIVDGVEGMRVRVRELIRAGADVIKVCTSGGVLSPRDNPRHPQFSLDELTVCVAEAAANDLGVMAHAQGTPGIKKRATRWSAVHRARRVSRRRVPRSDALQWDLAGSDLACAYRLSPSNRRGRATSRCDRGQGTQRRASAS